MSLPWIPRRGAARVLTALTDTPTPTPVIAAHVSLTNDVAHVCLHRLRRAGYATRTGQGHRARHARTPAGAALVPLAHSGITRNAARVLNVIEDQPQTISTITRMSAANGGPRWATEVGLLVTDLILADLIQVQGRAVTLLPAGALVQTATRVLFGVPCAPPARPAGPWLGAKSRSGRLSPLRARILACATGQPVTTAEVQAALPDYAETSVRVMLSTLRAEGLLAYTRRGGRYEWRAA